MFKPMKSVAPTDKFPIKWPKMASRKLDGIRCVVIDGKAITKSMKPVPNHYIRNWLEANVPNGVDGEIISGPPNLETTYGKTFSAVMAHEGQPEFNFYVFDMAVENMYANERDTLLRSACKDLSPTVVVLEQTLVHSDAQMEALYEAYLEEGYEGIILKDPVGFYKYGRSTPKDQVQLKIKPEEDYEAEVLEVYEGMHNANESFTNEAGETDRSTHMENLVPNGMLGGFIVRDVLSGTQFKVAPGKLKHNERLSLWEKQLESPGFMTGKLIKYRCMDYGAMTNGAARHGRWIGWRDAVDI